MRFSSVVGLAVLGLVACGGDKDTDGDGLLDSEETASGLNPEAADSDGDGLDDGAEAALGADPLVADTDGDGLDDGDEDAAGTDPAVGDTDGDTYLDPWELTEGTDPLNGDSRIYTGYWPYNPTKDEMKQNEISGDTAKINKQFGRFTGKDQFGEKVDLYDFANEVYTDPDTGETSDVPVIFDLSGEWCYWCQELAAFLDGAQDDVGGYEDGCWVEVRKAINQGKLRWVTVLDADMQGNPADDETVARWYGDYPKDEIPVLADPDFALADYMEVRGYPTVLFLGSDLVVEDISGGWDSAMFSACDALGL